MNLNVTGMALSYQWCPSLSHFQDILASRWEPSPSLVDHPGEVMLQALDSSPPQQVSRLGLIYPADLVDLSDYQTRFSAFGSQVDLMADNQQSLLGMIELAQQLLAGGTCDQVGICSISEFGSASLVITPASSQQVGNTWVRIAAGPSISQDLPEYFMISNSSPVAKNDFDRMLSDQDWIQKTAQPLILDNALALDKIPTDVAEIFQLIQTVAIGIIPAQDRSRQATGDFHLPPNFIRPKNSRPWFSTNPNGKRVGALIFESASTGGPAVLTAVQLDPILENSKQIRSSAQIDPLLFLISGDHKSDLAKKLEDLERALLNTRGLEEVSTSCFKRFQEDPGAFRISLLARDHQELRKEIQFALHGLDSAFTQGKPWSSPQGSYFTPDPLGDSRIAFVYPGAFNSYPGMGKELFFSFPGLETSAMQIIDDMNHNLAAEMIYPVSSADLSEAEAALYQHPNRLIESGISLSVLLTILFEEVFDLQPDIALGYSLGEISMLWANRIWSNSGELSRVWNQSQLFKSRLSGRMDAIREFWKDHQLEDDFWASFILKAPRTLVEQACEEEPLVNLAIVNTEDEVVIVGEKNALQRVISALKCRSLPMPFTAAIHTPAMQATYPDFIDLYNNPSNPRPEVEFFTAAHYGKLEMEREQLARSMASMTCSQLDFPRLINEVYDHGARIFIEIGPQKTCSRWIERILGNRPHAVIPTNKKHQSDLHGILKVVALLVSHGCVVDLKPIFPVDAPAKAPHPAQQREQSGTGRPAEDIRDRAPASVLEGSLSHAYLLEMDRMAALATETQSRYLDVEAKLTENIFRTIALESELTSTSLPGPVQEVLYSRSQIQAFTIGDHRDCFGDLYSGFGERRIPRLPNGDLLFLDRVMDISEGTNGRPSLSGEVDPVLNAWYSRDPGSHLPLVSLLEISLQPCGFLSAARGTIQGREDQDLYFRNLGGEAMLIAWPADPSGPIESRVELISTNSLDDVIIQNYSFQLIWGGEPFFSGSSSFGYFPRELLSGQPGLNGSNGESSWIENDAALGSWMSINPGYQSNGKAHLPVFDQLWGAKNAGRHSSGYFYLNQPLQPGAWFFKNHFYQDPVMPGSLGVETMARALTAGVSALHDLPGGLKWRMKAGEPLTWKYRGQIHPEAESFQVRLHVKDIEKSPTNWILRSDGELWRGAKHIYQVDNICLESY